MDYLDLSDVNVHSEAQKLLEKPFSEWGNDELLQAIKEARDALELALAGELRLTRLKHRGELFEDVTVIPKMGVWIDITGVDEDINKPVCEACLAGCYFIGSLIKRHKLYIQDISVAHSNLLVFRDLLRLWNWDGKHIVIEISVVSEQLERLGLRTKVEWEGSDYDPNDPPMVLEMLNKVLGDSVPNRTEAIDSQLAREGAII